jgi:BirA family biotin operon repressor/biotin-[acetyl-CoA-carboxylase] ligase
LTKTSDDILSAAAIAAATHTRWLGRPVYYWPAVGSTNDELKRLAEAGAPEGTLAIADEQTAGRGRLERSWLAPPGSSLLMSLLFRPTFLPPARIQQLTMICALALADAVAEVTGVEVDLKWPNDIQLSGKKLAGILTELGFDAALRPAWAVVGTGLNVNLDFAGLPQLVDMATSLSLTLGRLVPRLPLLRAYLASLEARYDALRTGATAHHEWADRLATLGKSVTITTASGEHAGVAEAVDDTGALLLRRCTDGILMRILAGDVTLRR